MTFSKKKILELLEQVKDPEIPVLNVVEMGIVRDVKFIDDKIEIDITPTYSGCPAMKTIEDEIKNILNENGILNSIVNKIYSPPWTTDWITEDAKRKLKQYGIAPPEGTAEDDFTKEIITKPVECPFCNSKQTQLTSQFGSTACKSLWVCQSCGQPFEHFKYI
ncbi:1,2-phenylacetyl-CoA epoxidase subunit PaaD [Melioribacteraceae bacterium 4301-Me]|uniref:1,2-phenylacetyl-CoA epoxidase subunit PaaD n=1 Tax=Pyranulibacter aquaticus TaxID=3163344 RepID=UPI0035968A72